MTAELFGFPIHGMPVDNVIQNLQGLWMLLERSLSTVLDLSLEHIVAVIRLVLINNNYFKALLNLRG